jgi:para-nitrobenzyl esterase
VRDATAFGAICAQLPSGPPNAQEVSDEDCLFLNVWTAEWPGGSRKPVMVWIPGGGNYAGGSSDIAFDGESLARHGVVLVTLNYRLGSFGFFAHPALTRESTHRASGNQGILDQIAALNWVRDNIANFGGDATNVTIFGESAGSLNVSVLMTSPLSKGLFHRVIGQSGTVVMTPTRPTLAEPLTLAQAEQRGETFAARWIPGNASFETLRTLSAADILKGEPNYNAGQVPPYLGVSIDGYVLLNKPAEVFATGQEHRVALLLGSNARDRVPGTVSPTDLKQAIDGAYGPIAGRAQVQYVGATDPVYGTPADQWNTDVGFRCSTVAQLLWHSAAGNPAFQYEFARVPPGREALGATHGLEISYVFGTLERGIRVFFGPPAQSTTVDAEISEVLQQYWTNFAKTGNPNGGRLPAWPNFDVSSRAYMHFTDEGPIAKENLRRPYCDLFIENLKRLSQ